MKKFLLVFLMIILSVSLCLAACNDVDVEEVDPSKYYAIDMDIGENLGNIEDYSLPVEDGCRQVVVYWREAAHSYSDNDIWLWHGLAEGRAYEFHPCAYGAKAVVNVPDSVDEVGFIVRKGATSHDTTWGTADKVYADNRTISLIGDVTEIYLTGANPYQFESNDGGKTLTVIKKLVKATISELNEISFTVVPATKLTRKSDVTVYCNGQKVSVSSFITKNKTVEKGVVKLKKEIDFFNTYTVEVKGFGKMDVQPYEVYDSKSFAERYNYDGELGVITDGHAATFKVWAPTARSVILNLYSAGDGGAPYKYVDMSREANGVWSCYEDDVTGKYYTYTVETTEGVQEAVDPYARSTGVNGKRGMVLDLATTNPQGFTDERFVDTVDTYTEAVIWETHVRDFSNQIASSQYKGKYLAFTETGLTNSSGILVGVDYVKNLGVTHIHLLPVFDYKTVDETKLDKAQFNWGYDPQNYNAPEGSYSTDPYHGEVRVKEFKQMVQALHSQGLGVIMDVVYNHTADSDSNFNKIVPNYYYRYNDDGTNSNGSGCGNDTASERYMYRKFMVDSVSYWAGEYKIDGFRFDLMGLHDVETMQAIEQAVHKINPKAIIYGEGWTMSTATNAALATQKNISDINATADSAGGVAVFNDVIRDGLRGSTFVASEAGYLGNPLSNNSKITSSLAGCEDPSNGWTVNNGAVINYISAHDNNTLWDKLILSSGKATTAERLAMNRMGAAIVMLSKGTPFMQSGEEMLRSKKISGNKYDDNSYKSSDAINNLKWESLTETSDEYAMMLYYKGLIAMRRSSKVLTANSGVTITTDTDRGVIAAVFDGGSLGRVVAVINNSSSSYGYTLPQGNWSLVCNGTQAGASELESASGQVTVAADSVYVYFSK